MEVHLGDEARGAQGRDAERRALEHDLAAVEDGQGSTRAAEGAERLRVPFGRVRGGKDLLAHGHEDAASARPGMDGGAHGGHEVGGAVPSRVRHRAHGPAEDDRLVALEREVEQERRLLQGVRAVGEDDAVDRGIGQPLRDVAPQPPHPVRGHVRPRQPRVVLQGEAGFLAQAVDAGHDLLAGHGGNGRAGSGIDAHGDGAAREQDVHRASRRHADSLRTTMASAARTSAPPATVSRPGTSPNAR